jgi:hypothetical protein
MRSIVLLLAGILVGCSGSDDKGTPGPGGDDDDDDDATTESAHTGGAPGGGIDVVAVGFEVFATLEADGTLTSYTFDGATAYAPLVILTFTDAAYFSATTAADQEGHFCTAAALMAADVYTDVTPLVKPAQIPTRSQALSQGTGTGIDNAILYVSYEVALNVLEHDCAGVVDAEKWGADGALLVDPFHGARFGYGFGKQTDYLRAAYLSDGETTNDYLEKYEDAMMATYVAINDANGDWYGYDWTTTILFENEPDTNQVLADDQDYLIPKPISFLPVGSDLPEGYLSGNAYWYQDFPLLDLSNLRDGAPQ